MVSFEIFPIFSSPAPLSFRPSFPVPSHLILKHWASFSLQLSPEEGYVSAKEDSFFYPSHSCEEEGLADKALFRADLALVSGHNLSSFLSKLLCLIFAFQNILKSCCILCSLCFWKLNIFSSTPVVPVIQNGKNKHVKTICWICGENWFSKASYQHVELIFTSYQNFVGALVCSNFILGYL